MYLVHLRKAWYIHNTRGTLRRRRDALKVDRTVIPGTRYQVLSFRFGITQLPHCHTRMQSTVPAPGCTHTALLMLQSSPRPVAFSCSTSKEALRCARYSFRFSFAIRGLAGLWSRTVKPGISCFVDNVDILSSRNTGADSNLLPVKPKDKRIVHRPPIIPKAESQAP